MAYYRVSLSGDAAKYFERCDAAMRERLKGKFKRLEEAPFDPQHSKALKGRKEQRSARVGNLRMLFRVDGNAIIVADIAPRGQVYKHGP